jgi:hypothetical protein
MKRQKQLSPARANLTDRVVGLGRECSHPPRLILVQNDVRRSSKIDGHTLISMEQKLDVSWLLEP